MRLCWLGLHGYGAWSDTENNCDGYGAWSDTENNCELKQVLTCRHCNKKIFRTGDQPHDWAPWDVGAMSRATSSSGSSWPVRVHLSRCKRCNMTDSKRVNY